MENENYLSRFITHWLTKAAHSPTGAPFIPLPWENLDAASLERLPHSLRPTPRLGKQMAIFGITLFVAGWLFGFAAVAAIGLGLFFVAALAFFNVWRQSGAWRVSFVRHRRVVLEGESLEVLVSLSNSSGMILSPMVGRVCFTGYSGTEIYSVIPHLAPGEKYTMSFSFPTDVGMGTHMLGPFQFVNRDGLGLHMLCTEHSGVEKIEVQPNISPLLKFPSATKGRATHSGAFQMTSAGSSVTFLGLRPWQTGDGIRKIDWKRSHRVGELLVKEFENLCSTDVSLFFDESSYGHSEFGGISSMETLRDGALSLGRYLLEQQYRVQLISSSVQLPFGEGERQADTLFSVVPTLSASKRIHFSDVVSEYLPLVPVDSMACLLFATGSVALEQLYDTLLGLEQRRVEVFLILIDSEGFAAAVEAGAGLGTDGGDVLSRYFHPLLRTTAGIAGDLEKVLQKLPARTFVLSPGVTLTQVAADRVVG